MQENEFEKRIRLKIDELQLVPGRDVWRKVSAEIHKEKRRKRFLILFFAFVFLAGSGAIYFYVNSAKSSQAVVDNNTKQSGASSGKKDRSAVRSKIDQVANDSAVRTGDIDERKDVEKIKKNEESSANDEDEYEAADNNVKRHLATIRFKEADVSKKTGESFIDQKEKHSRKDARQPLAVEGTSLQQQLSLSVDSVKTYQTEKPIVESKKDSAATGAAGKPIKEIKSKADKKWSFGGTVMVGVSDNISRFNLFSGGGNALTYSGSPSSSGGSNTAAISKLTYKANLSYAAGIYAKKHLSKTVSFSVGANYHFESATSFVGNRNNTSQTFYDLNLMSNATVNESYGTGNSIKYTNKYYLLELPLNVFIWLNKNQSKPIALTAGITPAYLAATKALYANVNQNVYYAYKDQFKKLLITGQAGVQFPVSNASHLNITAGPEVQYGLNNMAKSATGTSQHLSSAGIKVYVTRK